MVNVCCFDKDVFVMPVTSVLKFMFLITRCLYKQVLKGVFAQNERG